MPLTKNTPASTWIDDFKKSDAPQFAGKSPEKKRQMAIAAYMAKKNEDISTTNDSNPSIGDQDLNEDENETGQLATAVRGAIKGQANHVKAQMDGGYTEKMGQAGKIKQEIMAHMRDAHAKTQKILDPGFYAKVDQVKSIQRDAQMKIKDAQMRMHHVMVPATGKEVKAQQDAQMAQQQLQGAVQDKMGGAANAGTPQTNQKMNKAQAPVREAVITELSKDTLKSYMSKGAKSAIDAFSKTRTRDLFGQQAKKTVSKRSAGMKAANRKLNDKYRDESVDINELSDNKLSQYISAVSADSQKHRSDPSKRPADKRSRSIAGFGKAFNKLRSRDDIRHESATGHVGNEGGDGAANPLGSSSAPMEKVKVKTPPVVRNWVAKNAKSSGSGKHGGDKYKRHDKHKKALREKLNWDDVNDIRKHADNEWNPKDANVKFTNHFLDRVNDARNGKDIEKDEMIDLLDKEAKRYGGIAKSKPGTEGVMHSRKSDINMPFAINQQTPGARKDIVAKTVMRKKNFLSTTKKFSVESVTEAVKVPMKSMKEDEPGFSDGSAPGSTGQAGISTKPDVRKGALYGDNQEDMDGAYQNAKTNVDDDGVGNEIADKGWYAEKSKAKIDMRSKAFKEAAKKAAERAAKRTAKKKAAERAAKNK